MVYSNQGYMMVNRYGFQKLTICFYFTQTLDLPKKRFRVPTPALLHLDLPKDLGVDSPGIPKSPKKKTRKMLETKTSWVIMDSFGPGQISIAYVILIDIH